MVTRNPSTNIGSLGIILRVKRFSGRNNFFWANELSLCGFSRMHKQNTLLLHCSDRIAHLSFERPTTEYMSTQKLPVLLLLKSCQHKLYSSQWTQSKLQNVTMMWEPKGLQKKSMVPETIGQSYFVDRSQYRGTIELQWWDRSFVD